MSSQAIIKNKIYNCDCIDYLKQLDDRFIDTVVLDPPYYNVIDEKWDTKWKTLDEYLEWMQEVARQLNRVCKYSSCVWLFGFPYQLSYLIPIFERNGFTYKQHIVINKGIKSVVGRSNRYLKMFPTATEYIIFFYKESRYIIRDYLRSKQRQSGLKSSEINAHLGKSTSGGGTWSLLTGNRKDLVSPLPEHWDKLEQLFGGFDINYKDYVYKFNLPSNLTDVWDDINFYDKTYPRVHPTQKPYKLINRLIECTTDEGDRVLDIFAGSGMTALVCRDTKRDFYGCEINTEYVDNNLLK